MWYYLKLTDTVPKSQPCNLFWLTPVVKRSCKSKQLIYKMLQIIQNMILSRRAEKGREFYDRVTSSLWPTRYRLPLESWLNILIYVFGPSHAQGGPGKWGVGGWRMLQGKGIKFTLIWYVICAQHKLRYIYGCRVTFMCSSKILM